MKVLKQKEAHEFISKFRITSREQEIINLIEKGKTNKEISEKLFLSRQTIKNYIYNIYQKTGVKNRGQLIWLVRTFQNGNDIYDKPVKTRWVVPGQVRDTPDKKPAISNKAPITSGRKSFFWSVLITAILIAVGVLVLLVISQKEFNSILPPENSIAVLPFVDLSPQKDQAYICDGLVEEIIYRLTKISSLRIPGRTSSFSLRGKKMDIDEIGHKLNVENVLEGSLRKEGDKLRITVQLINVKKNVHLWAERYECKLENIFEIQDKISSAIIDNLKIKLLEEDRVTLAQGNTDSLEAYNSFLRGQWSFRKRTGIDLEEAVQHFEKAIEIDPEFARAYVGLASSYLVLPEYSYRITETEAYAKAGKAIRQALEIDDRLAEAHASLAILYRNNYDWVGAEREFQKAIEYNPTCPDTHQWYALFLMLRARFDEALEEIKIARELDPLSLVINRNVGVILFYARRYDEAAVEFEKTLEMDPNFIRTRYFLGRAFLQKKMYTQAMEEFESEEQNLRYWDSFLESQIGITYVKLGRKSDAKNVLNNILEKLKFQDAANVAVAVSILSFALGEYDRGFEYLEEAYKKRCTQLLYLKIDPRFDCVRSDSRFRELMHKIGLLESSSS